MMRSLLEPRNIQNVLPGATVGVGQSVRDWLAGSSNQTGSETLHATVSANRGTIDADARLSSERDAEYDKGKISEHNFGRDPVGYGDIGRLVSGAKDPDAGMFAPAPKDPYGAPFKERLLSIARHPETRNVEDRRGIDIRKNYTIDEWINRKRMEPM